MTPQEIVILNLLALVVLLLLLIPLAWAAVQDGRYNSEHQVH
jgi:hypothetical protein